ncbi:MAG: thioredoxin domain-containing protein [Actinomycetota bacterium]
MRGIGLILTLILIISVLLNGCRTPSPRTPPETKVPNKATKGKKSTPSGEEKSRFPRKFEVTEKTPGFFENVLGKRPILVEFYAPWCASCREMAPTIKELKEKYHREVTFFTLNVDDEKTVDLAEQFAVRFIPHIVILDEEGYIVFEETGYTERKVIEQALFNAIHKKK